MENYKKLFMGFFYAFRGIFSTLKTERNMRIHLTCVIYMLGFLLFSDWFVLTKTDWVLLLIASALVLSGEVINTAIEHTVNMFTSEYNEFAKKAKDAASGAVLINAIFAVIIGLIVLLQPTAFAQMFTYFKTNPLIFALFILSIIPATLFIFFGFGKSNDKKTEKGSTEQK